MSGTKTNPLRSDRHRLTIIPQSLMGAWAVALGAGDLAAGETIPGTYGLTLASGLLTTFDIPTRRTLSLELAGPDRLANVLSLTASVMTGARIIGPALAAGLAAAVGTGWVFMVNGLTFLAFLGALARMDTNRFQRIEPAPHSPAPVRDGLREVWGVPPLRVVLMVFTVVSTR